MHSRLQHSSAFVAFQALVALMSVSVNAATTTVPIRLHGTEAPVVIVRVQGRDLPLQFDLGDASSLVLHPEVLTSLRHEPTADRFKAFSMDGKIDTPIFRLDLVEIGSLKLRGVAVRQDVHEEGFRKYKRTEVGAVGFIGTGVLEAAQIRLDYPRTRLTISLPDKSKAAKTICRGMRVPLVPNQYGFTIPVDTDVGILQLGWDTGTPANIISRTRATAAGLGSDVKDTVFKKLVIGHRDFGPQSIEIWDIPLPTEIAGLIGHPFFAKHVVCFDFAASAVHVE
jgi:hypothetical protein